MKAIFQKIISRLSVFQKLFLAIASILLIVLFSPVRKYTDYQFREGGFWKYEDLLAPFNFAILKPDQQLSDEYAEANRQSVRFFKEDTFAYDRMIISLSELVQSKLQDSIQSRKIINSIRSQLDRIYSKGVLESLPEGLLSSDQQVIVMRNNYGEQKHYKDYYGLVTVMEILHRQLSPLFKGDSLSLENQIHALITPNIFFDEAQTQEALELHLSEISTTAGMLSAGELIITKGELITAQKALILNSLAKENKQRYDSNFSRVNRILGSLLLVLIAYLALFLYLRLIRHPVLEDTKKILLLLTVILAMIFVTRMLYSVDEKYLLLSPLCLGVILLHVFFDIRLAIITHFVIVFMLGFLFPNSIEFVYYQILAGIFTVVSLRSLQRRAAFFQTSIVIFCVFSIVYLAKILLEDTHFDNVDVNYFVLFLFNALMMMFAYPMIYVMEKIFGMVSQISLMELSSTNSPALRQLAALAPGTFQHSVQVATISEDLVNEIGGDANLARVGALYHDIGKMNSAMYFTENQITDLNPHDELTYEESASIILSHVPDGVQIAHKYKLPELIIDFIRTHHGTTTVGYFYAKQKQKYPNVHIDEDLFTYKGPKPYSRENAVVMLVDSVEAATRSLKVRNDQTINDTVDSIIEMKIKENQLSNCNMTYHDVDKIKRILKKKMQNIYHVRIEYPVSK